MVCRARGVDAAQSVVSALELIFTDWGSPAPWLLLALVSVCTSKVLKGKKTEGAEGLSLPASTQCLQFLLEVPLLQFKLLPPVGTLFSPCVSFLWQCNTLLPKFNNKYYLSHTFSAIWDSRSGLPGWFWLRASREVAVRMLAGAEVVWRLDWDCRILSCHW